MPQNLKTKAKDRQSRINAAIGDEDLEKKEYEEEFDKVVTEDELKDRKKELAKLYAKDKDEKYLKELQEIEKKLAKLKGK